MFLGMVAQAIIYVFTEILTLENRENMCEPYNLWIVLYQLARGKNPLSSRDFWPNINFIEIWKNDSRNELHLDEIDSLTKRTKIKVFKNNRMTLTPPTIYF